LSKPTEAEELPYNDMDEVTEDPEKVENDIQEDKKTLNGSDKEEGTKDIG
jgi:hypothetical protein